jgi:membrane peptidoglycan carboxypeptidase
MKISRAGFIKGLSIGLPGVVAGALAVPGCRKPSDYELFSEGGRTERYLARDKEVQQLAEERIAESLREKIAGRKLPPDTDCAFVLIEVPGGNVLAYLGTIREEVEFDNASNLVRSCGSLAKPVCYAAALQFGRASQDEMVMDAPRGFDCGDCPGGVWRPKNYGGNYAHAPMTLREAFARSRNIPAIEIYRRLPRAEFTRALDALGLPHPKNFTTAPLGVEWKPFEIAVAFTSFVNHGTPVEPGFDTGPVVNGVEQRVNMVNRDRVFREDVCQFIIGAGRDCLSRGTGRGAADLADRLAGKTGSADSALAALFGPRLCAVIWIGNRSTNDDLNSTGGALAMPLMADFFRRLWNARPELLPKWS